MTLAQFCGLLSVYVPAVVFILVLTYQEFTRVRFNFNVFFSLLYLLTFYFGFPLTCLLVFQFYVVVVPAEFLLYVLLITTAFYAIYYVTYKTRLQPVGCRSTSSVFTMNKIETHITWILLALVAMSTVGVFFLQNGFLLFKLNSYSQIFSSDVSGVALKRFFYFFIPAMLVVYFLKQTTFAWWFFLGSTVVFGVFTYVIVGGTRANIVIAFALFLLIGIQRGWITLWMLVAAGSCCVVGMFWLALKRYRLDVSGPEAFYTFLYLTRDTFSPWENVGILLQNYNKIDFQGLAPIIRDFYVFIPSWLWPDRPNLVWNTSNYFTRELLDNHLGLAISPTLIGSLVVMGGVGLIPPGAIIVGLIIKWFDWLYEKSRSVSNRYKAAILQSFCFGAIFNMIVLIREGLDSFVSRVVFFFGVFGVCLVLAKLLYWLLDTGGLIKPPDESGRYSLLTMNSPDRGKPNTMISIPKYSIRGFEIYGFRDTAQLLNHLFAGGLKAGTLVAMNAEKLLNAEQDTQFRALIDEAEYKYADGISIVRAIRHKYPQAIVSRVAGIDLWKLLMQRAGQEGIPVFLIGGKPDILQQTAAKLRAQWNVNIAGSQHGYYKPDQRNNLLESVRASKAAIVTVAMGSPGQEILMHDCRKYYPQALYMGVGGTYDVFTGHVKRAPKIWQDMGLEWLYRLLSQPSRIRRQIKLLKFLGYYCSGRL